MRHIIDARICKFENGRGMGRSENDSGTYISNCYGEDQYIYAKRLLCESKRQSEIVFKWVILRMLCHQ
jgi:hypothetical protein